MAVIADDGIGSEVLTEGVNVLKAIAAMDEEFQVEFPWGCEYGIKKSKMMDKDGLGKLKKFDAIYSY